MKNIKEKNFKASFTKALYHMTHRIHPDDLPGITWMMSHAFYEPAKKEYTMGLAKQQADGTWNARALHGENISMMYTLADDKLGEKLTRDQAIELLDKFDQDHKGLHRRLLPWNNPPYPQKVKKAISEAPTAKP